MILGSSNGFANNSSPARFSASVRLLIPLRETRKCFLYGFELVITYFFFDFKYISVPVFIRSSTLDVKATISSPRKPCGFPILPISKS